MRSPQRIGDFIGVPHRLWCRPLSHLEMFVCFEVSAGCRRRAGASAGSVCVCEAFAGPQGPLRDTQLGKKVGMRWSLWDGQDVGVTEGQPSVFVQHGGR